MVRNLLQPCTGFKYQVYDESPRNAQPHKVAMDISEKNETKARYRITFRASNSVNG